MSTSHARHLVMLPGLLCDARLWQDQADALSDLVTPFIADLTRDDSVAGMARRVLSEAPPTFALAALSMGGYVAFEILRQAPERVTRLTLFDTNPAPDAPERAVRRRRDYEAVQHGRFVGISPRLLAELVHPSRIEGPVGQEVVAMAQRVGKEAFLRQQKAIMTRPDSRPLLPTIQVPTLIAFGEDDLRTPVAIAREMRQAIPRSRLHLFRHCGHLPPLELPEQTSAVLRAWLKA